MTTTAWKDIHLQRKRSEYDINLEIADLVINGDLVTAIVQYGDQNIELTGHVNDTVPVDKRFQFAGRAKRFGWISYENITAIRVKE